MRLPLSAGQFSLDLLHKQFSCGTEVPILTRHACISKVVHKAQTVLLERVKITDDNFAENKEKELTRMPDLRLSNCRSEERALLERVKLRPREPVADASLRSLLLALLSTTASASRDILTRFRNILMQA